MFLKKKGLILGIKLLVVLWAYQGDSTHADFPKYNNSQEEMYQSIVDAVKEKIVPNRLVQMIVPCGTSIQNLRNTFVGDTVTREMLLI